MCGECEEKESFDVMISVRQSRGGDSTLIRRVCATGVLNLSPCSGVGKPKKDTLLWSYHFLLIYCIVLYCIVLYCIVLYCIVLYCIVLYCIVLYCIVLYCIVLYCIVLYCIVLYQRRRYIFNQMSLPFRFCSIMFVQKSFKFPITVISLSDDICIAFQD